MGAREQFHSVRPCAIGSASAVGVVGADHNWTIQLGNRYYGLAGYDAKIIPGLRLPNETRLHFGRRVFSLWLPFHWIAGTGLGLLGAAMVTCSVVWKART